MRHPTRHLVAAVDAAGLLLTALALRLALRHGPLRLRHRPGSRAVVLWAGWTVGYAVYGDWLLAQLLSGGPDVPGPHPRAAVATAVALACAVVPAAGCAHWFAVRGRRGLASSRALAELASRVRPLLVGATGFFLGAALALAVGAHLLLAGAGRPGGRTAVLAAGALALLLFLARLLAVHGFPTAAAAGLGSAAALEAAALCLVLAARLPGLAPLGTPVETLVAAAGPAAVPAAACALGALGLLARGLRALTGACAHPPAAAPERRGGTSHRPAGGPPVTRCPTSPYGAAYSVYSVYSAYSAYSAFRTARRPDAAASPAPAPRRGPHPHRAAAPGRAPHPRSASAPFTRFPRSA
ncbi:hypothetical protein O1L55_33680 [Streptomyces albulus]|nr:hypothetical protein [Streptomyces noursei]